MKLFAAVLAVIFSTAAAAQPFPAKPIRMLVGFAPGGAPDILARVLGQRLADALGQPILVENRPGATGNIAADAVAKSAPDGYTLLMATVSVAIGPSVQKLGFDPARDFEPIAMVASVPLVLVTHPSVAANSVRELIELAKAQPGPASAPLIASSTSSSRKQKTPALCRARGFLFEDGVAVTYFRMRKRHTIIGANSFHGPVRDGKAWFQAAMAAT